MKRRKDWLRVPALPRYVWTALGLVPVSLEPELRLTLKDEPVMGLWSSEARTIRVRAGMHPSAMWQTFHHEDMHRMLGDAGVHLSPEQEEAVCDAYALAKVAEMLWK